MNDQLSVQIKVEKLMQLLKVIGGLVVLAAAAYGFYHWREEGRREKSVQAFEALFEVEAMEEKAMKEAELLSSDPLAVFKTWPAEKKAEYLDKLAEVQRKFPGTAAAASAGLKIGRWHVEEKAYDEATKAYRAIVESPISKHYPLYAAMALEGWGVSLESLNKNEEALGIYEKSLNLQKNPLKPLAYMGKARNLKAVGKVDDARKVYESLIAEFPSTSYEKKARILMETLSL